jgi:hypothetical protein
MLDSVCSIVQRGEVILVCLPLLKSAVRLSQPQFVDCGSARIADNAMVTLRTGTEAEASQAIHTLKLARVVIDTDRLAIAYGNTDDKKLRERLARAFHELTGEKVEDRLAALND